MTITKGAFSGEERRGRAFQSRDGDYPEGSDVKEMMNSVPGAEAQQSAISKGLGGKTGAQSSETGPVSDPMLPPGEAPVPPRSLYSAEVGLGVIGDYRHPLTTSGSDPGTHGGHPTGDLHANPASTGKQALGKPLMGGGVDGNERQSMKTGAGQGRPVVKSYGPGGVGGPPKS